MFYMNKQLDISYILPPLPTGLSAAGSLSESEMSKMTQRVGGVNDSVLGLAGELKTHSGEVDKELHSVGDSVQDLQDRMAAFESHPPTIGEVGHCVLLTHTVGCSITGIIRRHVVLRK